MSQTSHHERDRTVTGRFISEVNQGVLPTVPYLEHWTVIAFLPDGKERCGTTPGIGFIEVEDAPVSLRDAHRLYDHGMLVKATRRIPGQIQVIVMSPKKRP